MDFKGFLKQSGGWDLFSFKDCRTSLTVNNPLLIITHLEEKGLSRWLLPSKLVLHGKSFFFSQKLNPFIVPTVPQEGRFARRNPFCLKYKE